MTKTGKAPDPCHPTCLALFYWGSECTESTPKGDINENNIPCHIKVTIDEFIKNFRGAQLPAIAADLEVQRQLGIAMTLIFRHMPLLPGKGTAGSGNRQDQGSKPH